MKTKRGRMPAQLLKTPNYFAINLRGKSYLIYKRVKRSKDGAPVKQRKRRKVRRPIPKAQFIYHPFKQIKDA